MDDQFTRFDALLQQETNDLSSLTEELNIIEIDLVNIRKSIKSAN
jgi:hypothetical protein